MTKVSGYLFILRKILEEICSAHSFGQKIKLPFKNAKISIRMKLLNHLTTSKLFASVDAAIAGCTRKSKSNPQSITDHASIPDNPEAFFKSLCEEKGGKWEEFCKQMAQERARITRLEQQVADMQEFVNTIVHDLREPIRTILGFSRLLSRKNQSSLSHDSLESLTFILDGAHRLDLLIGNMFEWMVKGKKTFQLQEVDFNSLVSRVEGSLYALLKLREGQIDVGPLPATYAYQPIISLVFQNLIQNAIKFSREGKPDIKIRAIERPSHYEFQVEDSGIGIPQSKQKLIFCSSFRIDNEGEGLGMGLAICKKIIDLHHGEIWVDSTIGKGSTFCFTIPKNMKEIYEKDIEQIWPEKIPSYQKTE